MRKRLADGTVRCVVFQIGDRVVHPMHGGGILESIVEKKVDGTVREYYVMKLPNRSMVVLIPVQGCAEVGIRPVMSPEQADSVLLTIPELDVSLHQFIRILRELAGVTVTPGTEFGPQYVHQFRINFSQDKGKAVAAMERFVTVLERYRKH